MKRKPRISNNAAELRRRAVGARRDLRAQTEQHPLMAVLHRRAEIELRKQKRIQRPKAGAPKSTTDPERLLHELQIHQIELEMQNAELQKARDELEVALEKFTDLYDFAPVGYFSIDESGSIMEANLTGATLLGVERSRLVNRRLLLFVSPTSRPGFHAFLEKVFTESKSQTCEALLLKEGGGAFWASFRAASALPLHGMRKWCRVAFADITARKQAQEAQRRVEVLAAANRELKQEITRRQTVENALHVTEQHQGELLKQSRQMEEQLRQLSHRILHAQEEERKRISRELHDEIAQTLVGINVHLAALAGETNSNPKGLKQRIARTQRLVEESVEIVHRFARELRPTALDDLGLIPALHAFMKEFTKRTGVRTHLTAFAAIEELPIARRTVLYRVAHEALSNVSAHAQASRVQVSIQKRPDGIWMNISDDGKSFDVERTLHANHGKRLGLLGMRERLEMVGGRFEIDSVPGKGTSIKAHIPLGKSATRGGGGAKSR